MRKRRKFSHEFKAKVALEALQERAALSEIAKRYEVHPNQVTEWKRELRDKAGELFRSEKSKSEDKQDHKSKEDRLYKQIGHLQMKVDFLKESCDKLGVPLPPDDTY